MPMVIAAKLHIIYSVSVWKQLVEFNCSLSSSSVCNTDSPLILSDVNWNNVNERWCALGLYIIRKEKYNVFSLNFNLIKLFLKDWTLSFLFSKAISFVNLLVNSEFWKLT